MSDKEFEEMVEVKMFDWLSSWSIAISREHERDLTDEEHSRIVDAAYEKFGIKKESDDND